MAVMGEKEAFAPSATHSDVGLGAIERRRVTPKQEFTAARDKALLQISVEAIQNLTSSEAAEVQALLMHGQNFGVWETPRKWKATEHSQARLFIDLRKRIAHFLPKEQKQLVHELNQENLSLHSSTKARVNAILDGAVLQLTRYLILLRMGPAGIGVKAKNTSLDPSNVLNLGYSYLPPLIAISVSKWVAAGNEEAFCGSNSGVAPLEAGYLNKIQTEDLNSLSEDVRTNALREAVRMVALVERGCWSDVPGFYTPPTRITQVAGPASAPQAVRQVVAPHLPLPDEYVSTMGQRSLWLIQELAPNLLALAEQLLSIWYVTDKPEFAPSSVQTRRRTQVEKLLDSFVWRDSRGEVIDTLPFPLRLAQQGKHSSRTKKKIQRIENANSPHVPSDEEGADLAENVEWPPRLFGEVIGLINNVQLAHLFVVALSTGGRKSETLQLKRDCVQYAVNGEPYANGRTFKLVELHDGQDRDWVLPELAVQAIEQQVRLVSLAERIGPMTPERHSPADMTLADAENPTHLWAQLSMAAASDRTAPLLGLNRALLAYARALGMDLKPGGQNLRPHRFRKTVARLAALALTQAPKILMDVFGHKSIEMTLYYILSDPSLQVEIEQVSRELRVMRAKEIIEKMVLEEDAQPDVQSYGGFGGPAALTLYNAVKSHKERLHGRGEKWNANSAIELAEILTLHGKAWQLIRKGVICTKFPGTEFGPCNKSTGHPEPSRCEGRCNHRLEEEFLRQDVDSAIEEALRFYQQAEIDGEELMQAHWAGQIRAQISRFENLKVKWMCVPTIRSLVEQSSSGEALL